MIRGTHDIFLVIEVLRDRLATMYPWYEWWSGHVECCPLDVAEERMRFDVLGVVRVHDMASSVQIASATRSDGLVTEYPIVLAVALGRQTILSFFKKPHYEIDRIPRYWHEWYAIDVRTSETLFRWEAQPASMILIGLEET
jgi:hypothetical protein